MSKKNSSKQGISAFTYIKIGVLIGFVIAIWAVTRCSKDLLHVEHDNKIGLTPSQIQSIRNIGQWEFLSVSDEELVDTTRRGLFSDDHLVRIYYGTLRIGIDLSHTREDWLTLHGDTIEALLPAITLLDEQFIDEARTRSFHESGRWTAQAREALYQKAHRQMLAHGLTPQNIASAQNQADAQMRKLLTAMGFKHIVIRFENEE